MIACRVEAGQIEPYFNILYCNITRLAQDTAACRVEAGQIEPRCTLARATRLARNDGDAASALMPTAEGGIMIT